MSKQTALLLYMSATVGRKTVSCQAEHVYSTLEQKHVMVHVVMGTQANTDGLQKIKPLQIDSNVTRRFVSRHSEFCFSPTDRSRLCVIIC